MRRLAQRLNSGTATLYRHFDDRADLIGHVVDYLFGQMDIDLDQIAHVGWEEGCRRVAQHMFAVLGRHRGAAHLLLNSPPTGPNAMIQRERGLALLLASGFPPLLAVRAYATLARYVLGFAIQLADREPADDQDAERAVVFERQNRDAFPATFAVAGALAVPLEEEFSFGLELMLDGLSRLRPDR